MSTRKKDDVRRRTVPPEKYARFISGLEFQGLRLREAEAKLLANGVDHTRAINLDAGSEAAFEMRKGSLCIVRHDYRLTAKYQGGKQVLFRVRCGYEVLYRVTQPMTDALFKVFKDTSLVLHTWPFFREYVHSATGRMSIPPLDLPVVKTMPSQELTE